MEEKKFFDFKGEEEFNLNVEYEKMFGSNEFLPANPGESKLKDAEVIIAETGSKYMEVNSLKDYEDVFVNLDEFLSKFRTDSEIVKGMTKSDRDKLFGYGKELFNSYQKSYSSLYFNFEMSIKEWNFVDHTLTRKLEYDGQELFNFWELYKRFIEPTREIVSKLPKQIESFVPSCSIQNLVLLSHLLMKHKEKASTESFHHFRSVLEEVAKMTKLFNAYGVVVERMTNKFNNWVNALNALDGYNNDFRTNEQTEE